jgi:putrescine transport system ATP-binding protein
MVSKASVTKAVPAWHDPAAKPHLRLTDIVKTFGSTRAVDGISLDIFPGDREKQSGRR